tara:strand:- start:52 stop:663 length:612 start_codon:yes stop_codon:yes gene_type:complete
MKKFQEFQQDIDESLLKTGLKVAKKLGAKKLAVKAIRKLTGNIKTAPFKAALKGPTVNMLHGTTTRNIGRIKRGGFKPATTSFKNPSYLKNKDFYKGKSYEPGRAFVTSDLTDAGTYANMAAKQQNKGILTKLGLRPKAKPVVFDTKVPKGDMRSTHGASTEFTVNTKNIQPGNVKKLKQRTPKEQKKGKQKILADRKREKGY